MKFNQGKLTNKPKPPNYRKLGGLALVTYHKQALSLKGNSTCMLSDKQVKCWFSIDSSTIFMLFNLNFADIKELNILPALDWYINTGASGAANILTRASRTLGIEISRLTLDDLACP